MRLALATVLVFLVEASTFGQGLSNFDLWAPAETSTYGGGVRPKEGYFFAFDGINWWIEAPTVTTIGFEGLTRIVTDVPSGGYDVADNPNTYSTWEQSNSHTTGFMNSDSTTGQRYDFGFISGHHGWYFSAFNMHDQNQKAQFNDVHVVFEDNPVGPSMTGNPPITSSLQGYATVGPYDNLSPTVNLPVRFGEMNVTNKVKLWGLEFHYLHRFHPGHHGGNFEWFLGGRYLEFDDAFSVDAFGIPRSLDPDTPTPDLTPEEQLLYIMADSYWRNTVENRIAGPQIGARWFKKRQRWTWSAEGRFFAGFNSQNVRQQVGLASLHNDAIVGGILPGIPPKLATSTMNSSTVLKEWSPGAEIRLNLDFQLTKSVSIGAGWTAFWIDNVARASNMFNYELPNMGINTDANKQDLLMHGGNLRIQVNR